ncbi:MAG: polyribonucleotide nucleotidyltransferase [Clostridiaceae bacterium]|nr:polyribonucleotide nucleotidyltransferase [Clostridiaceae bacterium]
MIRHMEFPNYKTYETTLGGRKLKVELGKMAGLANGSALVTFGDTTVLACATMAKSPRDGIDFFPLSVDFEEKLYAVGRIPGSFMRREGRPGERAILASRMIDRQIRPFFPSDMRNDVSVMCTVLSVDYDDSAEVAAMLGASIALSVSDIPWKGPIAGVQMGYTEEDGYVVCPNSEQQKKSSLRLTVSGSMDKVVMIEAGADQFPDDMMLKAIELCHEEIKKLVTFIRNIKAENFKEPASYPSMKLPEEMLEAVKAYARDAVRAAVDTDDKTVRDARIDEITADVQAHFAEQYPDSTALLNECMYKLQKFVVRRMLLDEGKRVDGRGLTDVRPLASEVGLIPRVHGSGLFTRGQTQVLTICTLGTLRDAQELDTTFEDTEKRYMHHYNFPGYSTGEAKPSRSPGRREIGHGALAEKALLPVIPSVEEFPYAYRLVSEVVSSNGSTSQGAICGSTLALMDAGVPIKAPVAGISCGLVTEGDRHITFTDIQGIEDFFGDMDFKVGGTEKGITAIQVDIKNDGLTLEIISEAFQKTRVARHDILNEIMLKAIPAPRAELSPYAPKMIRFMIDPEKIREVIGKGGSVIQKITADTNTKIDIEDDGSVCIAAINAADGDKARQMIEAIAKDPEVGDLFYGKVTRVMNFGAFVEIAPGKEGLIRINHLDNKFVEKVEDVLNVGDETWCKVIEIDEKGRINLSRKQALREIEQKKDEQ